MAVNHFDVVIVWSNLGGAVRVNPGGKATVTDPSTGALVTVVQDGQPTTVVTADENGRASFTADPQGIVKLTSGGLSSNYISAEQATAGAANAALAQDAQVAAETARDQAQAARDDAVAASANRVSKGEIVLNPADYGAALDGATDDTTAMQDAINAAATAGTFGAVGVVTWAGRAKVTGITLPAGVVLRGNGPSTVLVQSGAPSNLITATGTIGSSVGLVSDAAVGDTTLTLTSTTGIAAGDALVLSDAVSYNPLDSTYKSGEMVTVKAVTSGTQITLWGPIRGSFATTTGAYTVANTATVRKVTLLRDVGLESLSIEGDPATTTSLARFTYCDEPTVRNVHVRGGGMAAFMFLTCRNFTVDGGSIIDLVDDLAGGHVGYGVSATGACDGGTVSGVNIARVRHGFTTQGDAQGIPRRIVVTGCTVSGASTAALDTHVAGDDIIFVGNVITGGAAGISIRSRNTTVASNRIRLCTGSGVQSVEGIAANLTIVDNVIRDTGERGVVTQKVDGLTVARNSLDRIGFEGIRIDAGSTRVRVLDNEVRNIGMKATSRTGIQSVTPGSGSAATGWIVSRNFIGNDAGVGSALQAIVTAGGLTGSFIIDNRAFGTFGGTVFDLTTNTARRNEQIDVALPTNPDTSGATLAVLETEVNELKARLRAVGILG